MSQLQDVYKWLVPCFNMKDITSNVILIMVYAVYTVVAGMSLLFLLISSRNNFVLVCHDVAWFTSMTTYCCLRILETFKHEQRIILKKLHINLESVTHVSFLYSRTFSELWTCTYKSTLKQQKACVKNIFKD